MKKYLLIALVTILFACKKESLPFSEVPTIAFVGFSSDTISAGESVIIEITYQDGDGDLGDTEEELLLVTDLRDGSSFDHLIPVIVPIGESAAVTGDFLIHTPSLRKLGDDEYEKARFSITLKDRAGHVSNELETEELTIGN